MRRCLRDNTFHHFHTKQTCDRQTDRRTYTQTQAHIVCIALAVAIEMSFASTTLVGRVAYSGPLRANTVLCF